MEEHKLCVEKLGVFPCLKEHELAEEFFSRELARMMSHLLMGL